MKTQIITGTQSLEARDNLSLSQPDVVAGVRNQNPSITFNKGYMSEFEGGRRILSVLAQRALRDYYESQGHEFSDGIPANDDDITQPGDHVRVVRDAMIVCDRLSHSQRGAVQDRIRDLLEQILTEGKTKANEGIFDTYDDQTDLKRDKAIANLAEVGLLYSLLFRQCPIGEASKDVLNRPNKAKTISEVLAIRFSQVFKLVSEPEITHADPGKNSEKTSSQISA